MKKIVCLITVVFCPIFVCGGCDKFPMQTSPEQVKQDDPQAMYELGASHLLDGNKQEGMNLLRKAAEQGHTAAQRTIGYEYIDNGDKYEAIKWLRNPAEKGDVQAQMGLAACYGLDSSEGVEWLRKAAAQGDQDAIHYLKQIGR